MSTVVILGAGDLGGSVAHALAERGQVRRVVLIDDCVNVAAGKALDIQQSGAISGSSTVLAATDDVTVVTGAEMCVVADRVGPPPTEWQGEAGLAMLYRVVPYVSGAPIVFAGALQADLMLTACRELRLPTAQAVGSAAHAFASALRAIVAAEAPCSTADVMLAVLGLPPFVVPWSEASIGGYALDRTLAPVQIARIEARAQRMWPPGPYALGAAAARAVEAALTSSREQLSALALLSGEFGVRNRIGAVPVLLNKLGIARVRVPELNTRERVAVETSLL